MIEFFCSAGCSSEDEFTRLSGCGIVLLFIDDSERKRRRELGFALGNSSLQLAQIQSLRLALSSITPGHRKQQVIAHVDNEYVIDVLSGEESEIKAVDELRKWFGFYTNLKVIHDESENIEMERSKQITKSVIDSQEHHDSE